MALGKINHLQFMVEDLEKTLKYFTEKLGFKFVGRGHQGLSVDLVAYEGGPLFEFEQITEQYKYAESSERPELVHCASDRRSYLDHICFEVGDMDKEVKELKSRRVIFRRNPGYYAPTDRILGDTCDADGIRWIQLIGTKPPK